MPHAELTDEAERLWIRPRLRKDATIRIVCVGIGHGAGTVRVVEGGLEVANDAGDDTTVIANAAAIVRLDLP